MFSTLRGGYGKGLDSFSIAEEFDEPPSAVQAQIHVLDRALELAGRIDRRGSFDGDIAAPVAQNLGLTHGNLTEMGAEGLGLCC
jgi:hypothetical protein